MSPFDLSLSRFRLRNKTSWSWNSLILREMMCASLPFQPSAYPLPELMLYPILFVSLFPFLWFLISLSLPTIPPLPSKGLANHLALGQELKERAQSPSEAVPPCWTPNSLCCIVTFGSRSRRGFCAHLLLFRDMELQAINIPINIWENNIPWCKPIFPLNLPTTHEKKDYIGPPQPTRVKGEELDDYACQSCLKWEVTELTLIPISPLRHPARINWNLSHPLVSGLFRNPIQILSFIPGPQPREWT